MRAVAAQFKVSVSTVALWAERAAGRRLDRVDFSDRAPGCARGWNRLPEQLEQRILALREQLRTESVLGEYGARAISAALAVSGMRAEPPAVATINRVLARYGALDRARRVRRPPPPKGWYLPQVAAAQTELDCGDLIEDLKIAGGPLISVLNVTSLHGGLADTWPLTEALAKVMVECLIRRWRELGLPAYAQFDNGTQFQGAHQFQDAIGRVSRLCLALGVIPVFAPPREPGFQNAIEGFNGLWQAKVWQRHHFENFAQLELACARYIAAHRARSAPRREQAPARRPFPQGFEFDLNAPLQGTMIFLRRTDEAGRAQLLGRSFEVSQHWLHRLVRCEVDLSAQQIRFYALRRKDPTDQPLLKQVPYHRPHKPFQGQL